MEIPRRDGLLLPDKETMQLLLLGVNADAPLQIWLYPELCLLAGVRMAPWGLALKMSSAIRSFCEGYGTHDLEGYLDKGADFLKALVRDEKLSIEVLRSYRTYCSAMIGSDTLQPFVRFEVLLGTWGSDRFEFDPANSNQNP